MTTNTAARTITIWFDESDPSDSGLAWTNDDRSESGVYDSLDDLVSIRTSANDAGLTVAWDPNDGGSLTITGPADHPIIAAAR